MIEEIKNIKSGPKELKDFGITVGIVLGVLGGVFFLRAKEYYPYFFAFSFTLLSLGLLAPIVLKPLQKVWMSLSIVIGWFMTRLILAVLFYLVLTPIGVLAKLFGKDFLDTAFEKEASSYWIEKDPAAFDKRSYENQF